MKDWSLRDKRAHLALVLPAAIWFAPQLFLGRVAYFRDSGLYFQPHKALIAEALRHGRLPEWNPFEYGGMPLLADPNFNVFHPLSLFTDLLPLPFGFGLFSFVCAVLCAYGARALGRGLGLSHGGSLACALFFAWSGPTVSFFLTGQAVASCTLPWLCAAGARLGRDRSRRAGLWLALAAALQFLAGTPEIGACGFALAGLLALSEALCARAETALEGRAGADLSKLSPLRTALETAIGFALWAALGAGLSAIQLFPSALFVRDSSRGNGLTPGEALLFSLHPLRLPGLVLPFFTGDFDGPGAPSWLLPLSENPYVQEVYLGAGALVLTGLGLRTTAARRRWPLLAASILFAAIAFGSHLPLASLLWRTLPLLRIVRFPEKMIVPLSLAVAVGAGAGWERLSAWLSRLAPETLDKSPVVLRPALVAAGVMLALAIPATWPSLWLPAPGAWLAHADLGAGLQWPQMRLESLASGALGSLGLLFFLSAAAMLLFALVALGRVRAPLATVALAALFGAELASPALRLDRTAPGEDWSEPPALAQLLRDDARVPPSGFRISSQSNGLSTAQLDAIAASDGSLRSLALFRLRRAALFDASVVRANVRSDRGYSGFTPGALKRLYQSSADGAALDLLGVRYGIEFGGGASIYAALGYEARPDLAVRIVAADPALEAAGLHVYQNLRALPRAWLSPRVRPRPRDGTASACAGIAVPWLDEGDQEMVAAVLPLDERCAGGAPPSGNGRSASAGAGVLPPMGEGAAPVRSIRSAFPEQVIVDTDARVPALLVLAESELPGWRAEVDGAQVPILAAYGALRACVVPAGTHEIVFTYSTPGLRAGALVSLACLLLFALCFATRRPVALGDRLIGGSAYRGLHPKQNGEALNVPPSC